MHFNFHLDGNESPEKLRRIANAVLALGGMAHSEGSTKVGELTVGVNVDASQAIESLDEFSAAVDRASVAGLMASMVTENKDGAFTLRMPPHRPIIQSVPNAGESNGVDTTLTNKTQETQGLAEIIRRGMPNAGERNDSGSTAEWIGGVESNPEEGREFSLDEAVAAVASANAVAGDPKRDVNGLPWDERIHSSSRAVNADGSWRAKRGVDSGLVAAVEDELRAVAVHEAVSAPIPPAPPVPPTPPAPQADGRSYADVVNLIMSKKLSPEVYVAVLGESLPDFAKTFKANPAVADEMYEKLAGL